MASLTYPIRKLENLELKVEITSEFRFRVWTASQLVKLAAWVLGGRAEISEGK